jgi:hypothetical protein
LSLIPALVLLMRSLCAFSSFDSVPGTNCCLAIDATEAILSGCFHGSSGGAGGQLGDFVSLFSTPSASSFSTPSASRFFLRLLPLAHPLPRFAAPLWIC